MEKRSMTAIPSSPVAIVGSVGDSESLQTWKLIGTVATVINVQLGSS